MPNIVKHNRPNGVKSHEFLGTMPNGDRQYRTELYGSPGFKPKDRDDRISSQLRTVEDGIRSRCNSAAIYMTRDNVELFNPHYKRRVAIEDIRLFHPREHTNVLILSASTADTVEMSYVERPNGFDVVKTMVNSQARMVLTYKIRDGRGLQRDVRYVWKGVAPEKELRICVVWTRVLGNYLFPSGDLTAGRTNDILLTKKAFDRAGVDEFVFSKSTFAIGRADSAPLIFEDLTDLFEAGMLGNTVVGRHDVTNSLYFKFWTNSVMAEKDVPESLPFNATYTEQNIQYDGTTYGTALTYSGGTIDVYYFQHFPVSFGTRYTFKDGSNSWSRGFVQFDISALYRYAVISDVTIELTAINPWSSGGPDIDVLVTEELYQYWRGSPVNDPNLWNAIGNGVVTYTGHIPLSGTNDYSLGTVAENRLMLNNLAGRDWFSLGFKLNSESGSFALSFYAEEQSSSLDAVLKVTYTVPESVGIEIGETELGRCEVG